MSSKRVNIISLAFAKYVRPLRGRFVCIRLIFSLSSYIIFLNCLDADNIVVF